MRHRLTIRAFLAFVLLVAVAALARYDARQYRAELPDTLRYLPPESSAQFVLPNLGRSWRLLQKHGSSEFGPLSQLEEDLQAKCFHGVEFLRHFGLDLAGTAVAGAYTTPDGRKKGLLYVVPITDAETLAGALATEKTQGLTIHLGPAGPGTREPLRYVVRRVGESLYGRLCAPGHGVVVRDAEVEVFHGDPDLTFLPNPLRTGRLQLACRAFYADGSQGECTCRAKAGEQEIGDCLAPLTVARNDDLWKEFRPTARRLAGREILVVDKKGVAFPNDQTALLWDEQVWDEEDVVEAVWGNPEANLTANLNNPHMYRAVKHLKARNVAGDVLLFGFASTPVLPRLGSLTFVVDGDLRRLQATVNAHFQSMGLRFLKQLVARPRASTVPVPAPSDSVAGLTITHQDATYFLDFFLTFIDSARPALVHELGNFVTVLDTLVSQHPTGAIGLHVVEEREGVPVPALAIRVRDRTTADSIVQGLQYKLRAERDISVLTAAARKFCDGPPRYSPLAAYLDVGPSLLASETPSTWAYYTPDTTGTVCPVRKPWLVRSQLPAELFAASDYRTTLDGLEIHYVMPRVTENDLTFRFSELDLSEKDIALLLADTDRMAAHYDSFSGVLWFGIDAQGVHRAVTGSGPPTRGNTPRRSGRQELVHLGLRADWWLAYGSSHPESRVRDFVNEFLMWIQHHSVQATVGAMESANGLSATVVLTR